MLWSAAREERRAGASGSHDQLGQLSASSDDDVPLWQLARPTGALPVQQAGAEPGAAAPAADTLQAGQALKGRALQSSSSMGGHEQPQLADKTPRQTQLVRPGSSPNSLEAAAQGQTGALEGCTLAPHNPQPPPAEVALPHLRSTEQGAGSTQPSPVCAPQLNHTEAGQGATAACPPPAECSMMCGQPAPAAPGTPPGSPQEEREGGPAGVEPDLVSPDARLRGVPTPASVAQGTPGSACHAEEAASRSPDRPGAESAAERPPAEGPARPASAAAAAPQGSPAGVTGVLLQMHDVQPEEHAPSVVPGPEQALAGAASKREVSLPPQEAAAPAQPPISQQPVGGEPERADAQSPHSSQLAGAGSAPAAEAHTLPPSASIAGAGPQPCQQAAGRATGWASPSAAEPGSRAPGLLPAEPVATAQVQRPQLAGVADLGRPERERVPQGAAGRDVVCDRWLPLLCASAGRAEACAVQRGGALAHGLDTGRGPAAVTSSRPWTDPPPSSA